MTNLYIFSKASSTPAGFTDISGSYSGRYPRFTSTVGNHGVTGGSATHTHGSDSSVIGYSTNTGSNYYEGGVYRILHYHNHSVPSWSITSQNNDYYYYDVKLLQIDLETWEQSVRYFPVDTVFPSANAMSYPELTRLADADYRLLRIGSTPGVVGGRYDNNHTVTGTLPTISMNASDHFTQGTPQIHYIYDNIIHTHSVNLASSNNTHLPLYASSYLYYINYFVNHAPSGTIAFVDGATSNLWTPINLDGRFAMGNNGSLSYGGSATHGHTVSGNSSNVTLLDYSNYISYERDPHYTNTSLTHNHPITLNLSAVDHTPLYVNLYPVVLNTTLVGNFPRSQLIGLSW